MNDLPPIDVSALKSWQDFETARLELQKLSPRFSRAELCRRAGIDGTTFLKGLKSGTKPRPSRGSAVRNEIAAEAARLPEDQRRNLALAVEGERHAIAGGLR